MDRTPPINQYDEDLRPDVLIGRMIDGQASDDDRQVFETMADHEPRLWRELALRHEDAARLSASVEPVLDRLEGVCAPIETPANSRRRLLTLPVALSGWAAMIIVGLTWAIVSMVHLNEQPDRSDLVDQAPMIRPHTYMDHLERYRQAPWVLGEMQPTLLERQELSDGRIALRFLRRSEEVVIVETKEAEEALMNRDTGEINKELLKKIRENEDATPEPPTPPESQ